MAEFSMDPHELEALGKQAARGFAASMQPTMDALYDELSGQPVEQIKPRLAAAWHAGAGEVLSEPNLTEWSTHIANGRRVDLVTD